MGRLEQASEQYYNTGQETMSDSTYDALQKQAGGTAIGAIPTKNKVKHLTKKYSLDNVYSLEEALAWWKSIGSPPLYVQEKLDGLAISNTIVDGKYQAATRGDGLIGELVTDGMLHRASAQVLKTYLLNHPEEMLDGELCMTQGTFNRLNSEGEDFKTPRNAASGLLRRAIGSSTPEPTMQFVVYATNHPNWSEQTSKLRASGIDTVRSVVATDVAGLTMAIESMSRDRRPGGLDIDGLVLKVVHPTLREELGFRTKSPRWAVAFKFEEVPELTAVEDIRFQTGRLGTITPVATVSPVQLGGVTVTSATLHNEGEIERLGLRIGDTVTIIRSGAVIPKILAVAIQSPDGRQVEFPQYCECGGTVVKEGDIHKCSSATCTFKTVGLLRHFSDRRHMNINGLSTATVTQLVKAGISDPAALYQADYTDILELPGFGTISAKKLHSAIQASRKAPFAILLSAMGIENVGVTASTIIASRYHNWTELAGATREDLLELKGIGVVIVDSLLELLANPPSWFEDYCDSVVIEEIQTSTAMAGQTYVITGTLLNVTRDRLTAELVNRGASVSGSVSRRTTGLIAGERAGSKLAKAIKLGVPIIDEATAIAMIN